MINEWSFGKNFEENSRDQSRHYPGIRSEGLSKTTKDHSQDDRCLGRDSILAPSKYESRVLPLRRPVH